MRQIVYLSTARTEFGAAELDRILASSRRNNSANGVSGLLAYGQGVFLQVLEGEAVDIEMVLGRIEQDRRHHSIRILDDATIERRDFAEWSMAYTPLGAEGAQRAASGRLSAKDIPVVAASLNNPLIATFLKRFAAAA